MYIRKSNISPRQLDVHEANVSIPQFYRIRNHFVGCWTAIGWTTSSPLFKCYVHRTVPNHQPIPQHLETDARQVTVFETPNLKQKGNRDVDQWSCVDHVTTNAHSCQSESQLCIFEDDEAVITMIIKGRCPSMRHVSRTHRVALDWMFDRINLDPKIQIKYVDTRNELADMSTKGGFTRYEWNRHLRLNIMNLSMSSCSHFCKFLSGPVRKQSATSKRGQEGTSEESSPMAKSRSMMSAIAKPRPMSLVSHSLLSERNNSSRNLSDSSNPGDAEVDQGGVSSSVGKLTRDTSQNPAEQSQVTQQEDTQHAESSKSSSVWERMRGVETHKVFKIWN